MTRSVAARSPTCRPTGYSRRRPVRTPQLRPLPTTQYRRHRLRRRSIPGPFLQLLQAPQTADPNRRSTRACRIGVRRTTEVGRSSSAIAQAKVASVRPFVSHIQNSRRVQARRGQGANRDRPGILPARPAVVTPDQRGPSSPERRTGHFARGQSFPCVLGSTSSPGRASRAPLGGENDYCAYLLPPPDPSRTPVLAVRSPAGTTDASI